MAQGPEALLKALAAVEEECTDRNVHTAAAQVVAAGARPLAPVGPTRKLRGSIRASGTKARGVVRAGGPSIPWGPPAHWGAPPPRPQGGYMKPQPFLLDGADNRRDEVDDVFFGQCKSSLRRQGLT